MKAPAKNHYRKVRKEGGARVIALTPFIPADWKMVRVYKITEGKVDRKPYVDLVIERVV